MFYRSTLLVLLVCFFPVFIMAQESQNNLKPDNSLMDVEGKLVCIIEEMAKLRDVKPTCPEYGHIVGIRVSDGTIWSFYPNSNQKELHDGNQIGKKIKITGKLFYDGKIIEIVEYQFIEFKTF